MDLRHSQGPGPWQVKPCYGPAWVVKDLSSLGHLSGSHLMTRTLLARGIGTCTAVQPPPCMSRFVPKGSEGQTVARIQLKHEILAASNMLLLAFL